MAKTNRGFFLGMKYDHGLDFSEFTGDWPLPEAGGGCLKIYDDNNHIRMLVLDYYDGCFYDVSLRDGPTSTYVTEGFKDKMATNGTGGTDITPSVTFKEDTGEYEKFITEHHTSRFSLRPNKETNRNQTGYDSKGYPSGIAFKTEMFVDGEPTTASATSEDITTNNEVVCDQKVEGHRIHTKFSSNMSDFKLVGRLQEYITKDIQHDPDNRPTTEQSNQSAWNDNLIRWYTRGEIGPTTCRINGDLLAGTYTQSSGYDGGSNTSLLIQGANYLDIPVLSQSSTSRVYVWSNRAFTGVTITANSEVLTPVLAHSSTWYLYYFDITAANSNYIVRISNGGTDLKLFDIRIFNPTKTLTASQLSYYASDITSNNGDNLLPLA